MSPVRRTLADPVVLLLLFILLVSAFFLLVPEADIWVSSLFYNAKRGFTLAKDRGLGLFRRSGDIVVTLVAIGLVASVVVKLVWPRRPSIVPPNVVLFLVTTLILGPGILVNSILKDHWGRPRPVMVENFGGDAPYVPVWQITDLCASNCSFVAGEASSAIWLTVALALIVPAGMRVPITAAAFAYAVLLSLNRIAFGGHFVSDVVLSWGLTLLVMAIAWRFMVASPPKWLENERLEAGLTRVGLRFRGLTD